MNYILFFLNFIFIKFTVAENILGCNGFIKSDYTIDFSKIEIKLLSKERNLKDRTECAPNNGYYFVPLYDPGEYILSVTSQDNWIFSPTEVNLKFDRVSDPCSKGEDINFYFKGFTISGQVDNINGKRGAAGISVTLLLDLPAEQREVYTVSTDARGSFKFAPVQPGLYIIKAFHPRWKLSKSLVTFQVKDNNYLIPSRSLLLGGYDVSGLVVSNQEPISQVNFILFSPEDVQINTNWLIGCDTSSPKGFIVADKSLSKMKQLCFVTSNEKGIFTFPSVPSGNYAIVPFYQSPAFTKFDVLPKSHHITVNDDSVAIKKPFQIVGFSIKGRIVSSKGSGKPLSDVTVRIQNLNISTKTGVDGFYILEGIKSGSYNFEYEKDNFLFTADSVNISPNSPLLSDVYPSSFKVSGSVESFSDIELRVKFKRHDGAESSSIVSRTGYFEQYLSPGDFVVTVGTVRENTGPVWFSPVYETIHVNDTPIFDIKFTQLKGKLVGRIKCKEDICDDVEVSLRALNNDGDTILRSIAKGGHYKFENLLTGFYEVAIVNTENWCWESVVHKIHLKEIESEAPPFIRYGILFTLSSTHDAKVKYKKISNDNTTIDGILDVKRGTKNFCLPGKGSYEFEVFSCHTYDKETFKWSLGSDPMHLVALKHTVIIRVISESVVNDLYINVYPEHSGELIFRSGPSEKYSERTAAGYVYKFEISAAEGETFTVIPQSSTLLFSPEQLVVVGPNDCATIEQPFITKQGVRFTGIVQPPLDGVQVTVLNDLRENITSITTTNNGKYQFRPLLKDQNYILVAEKEGYVISGPNEHGIFIAKKLAEIEITVKDEDMSTLSNVLISLSGGENYRQTSQTSEIGKVSFKSLKPGEYYVRPMFKEYKFTPAYKVVNISEGITSKIQFEARRILYSIFGDVLSLNRMPEKGIIVEAIGKTDGLCVQLQEEATTESSGNFRIRGLQPHCSYLVRLKKDSSTNQDIYKVIPDTVYIQMNNTDVHGISLTTVPKLEFTDSTVSISVSKPDHMRSLSVKLCREDGDVIVAVKLSDWKFSYYLLNSIMVPMPVLPMNGANYYVQLDSTLPKKTYAFTSPIVHFKADHSFQLIKMSFAPQLKLSESETRYSYSMAIFLILAFLSYCYREVVISILQGLPYVSLAVPEFLNRFTERLKPKEEVNNFNEYEPGLTVVKRKIRARKT